MPHQVKTGWGGGEGFIWTGVSSPLSQDRMTWTMVPLSLPPRPISLKEWSRPSYPCTGWSGSGYPSPPERITWTRVLPLPPPVDRQTPLKTLPSLELRTWSVINRCWRIYFSYTYFLPMYSGVDWAPLPPVSSAAGERRRKRRPHCPRASGCAPAARWSPSSPTNTAK